MRTEFDAVLAQESLSIAKFSVAALVMDMDGNVLTCQHAERPGESPEGALGSVTETLRYVRSDPQMTESPIEALRRCLLEEHGIVQQLDEAGFHLVGEFGVRHGRWPVGMYKGVSSTYATFDLALRVEDPSVFINDDRPSDEIVGTEFVHAEALLGTDQPTRPGYSGWLRSMFSEPQIMSKQNLIPMDWDPLVKTSGDALRPYR